MSREQDLLLSLDALGVAWELHEHEAVFTVEESATLHATLKGLHTKNLFLKAADGQYWLVSMRHDIRVDLKALPACIGAKKLSFGKAEDMERLLGVSPGSVTPLAAFNDHDNVVQVVLDARLADAARINVHPLRNTATIGVSGIGLCTFLAKHHHPPRIVEIPELKRQEA